MRPISAPALWVQHRHIKGPWPPAPFAVATSRSSSRTRIVPLASNNNRSRACTSMPVSIDLSHPSTRTVGPVIGNVTDAKVDHAAAKLIRGQSVVVVQVEPVECRHNVKPFIGFDPAVGVDIEG